MTGGIGRLGAAVVLAAGVVVGSGGSVPAGAAPGVVPASAPPAGSVLQTGEFFVMPFQGPRAGKFQFTGRGDGQASNWSFAVNFFRDPAGDCLGIGDDGIDVIGLMNRDGRGPFGGHVGLVRFYRQQVSDQQEAAVGEVTGDQLLACLRLDRPDLPAGAAFTLADRLDQFSPAGAGAADGTFDLVTFSGPFGYMVNQFIPGHGWQSGASIGGNGSEPSVVRQRDGGLRVFVAGGGGHLYSAVISRDRHFSGWRNLGGSIVTAPYPVLNLDGSISAYVLGVDHQLYQGLIAPSGLFKGWIPLGKPPLEPGLPASSVTLVGQVAAAGTGGGRVTVVGTDDFDVFTRSYATGHWGPWVHLPVRADVYQAGFAGVSPAPGQMLLAWATQPPGFPAHASTLTNNRWGPLINLGGSVMRIFASQIGNRTDLWTDGFNGKMYQRTARAGHWSPWSQLPIG